MFSEHNMEAQCGDNVRDKTQCIKHHPTLVLLHGLGRIGRVIFVAMPYAAREVAVTSVRSRSSDGVH